MKRITMLLCLFTMISSATFAQTSDDPILVDQYGVKVGIEPIDVTAQNGILVFTSRDSDYKLWFDARVNLDGAMFFESSDLEDIGDGVSVRRARFAVKAQVAKNWYGEIDMDMADGIFELKDAVIRYDGIKNLQIQMGNFKEFVLTQRNTSSRNLSLIERPFIASALTPSRGLGINFKYTTPLIWASAGYFFQEVKSSEEAALVQDNNKDEGISTGNSTNLKLAIRPLHESQYSGLVVSSAYSYRTPKASSGLDAIEDEEYEYGFRYSSRATTSINRKKYLDTNCIPAIDEQIYNFELSGWHRGFRYEFAYQGVIVDPDADRIAEINNFIADEEYDGDHAAALEDSNDYLGYDASTKHFSGWYVQASYMLFGGQQRYDAGGNKMTRPTRGQDWGDLEIAARYDVLDLNDGGVWGGSAKAYTIGLNYYVNRQVKLMLNYQYTDNDEYANGKKGAYDSGYDADGEAVKGFDMERNGEEMADACGIDFGMLAFRIQIAF